MIVRLGQLNNIFQKPPFFSESGMEVTSIQENYFCESSRESLQSKPFSESGGLLLKFDQIWSHYKFLYLQSL